jgi:hypothetical protein
MKTLVESRFPYWRHGRIKGMNKAIWLALGTIFLTAPVRSAEAPVTVGFERLETRRPPIDAGAIRSQAEWDAAMRKAWKKDGTIPARTRPVDWKTRMVVAAPAFVSFVQRTGDALTVYVLQSPALPRPPGGTYIVSLSASPLPVRFETDPALHDGPCFIATATAEGYVGTSKTVVLIPRRTPGTSKREARSDIVYAPLGDHALETIANDLKATGFERLPEASTDRPGWAGEGWSCRMVAVLGGTTTTASYHGTDREGAPPTLLHAVRAIFAAGGSPGLPERACS